MNHLLIKKKAILNNATKTRIPAEYQEVEWIQSTGTQYIDLNYTPTINTDYIVDGCFLSDGRFGAITSTERHYFGVISGNWGCSVFNPFGAWNHNLGAYDTNRHIFSMSKDGFLIDDILKSSAGNNVINANLYAFATNNNVASDKYYANAKIYNITIKENGINTMMLIPCYRKSDNEVGMYDIINDTFYTNQGTGAFQKGGDV